MENLKLVEEYYQEYDEDNRLLKDNVHKLEFLTTIHYLKPLIKPNMKVLDVGAGTGTYSYYFANTGAKITAFELVSKNINIIKNKQKNNPPIDILQGDARDLSNFKENEFDVVLCLGPLYHLKNDSDKLQCISECLRVLKPNGIIVFAYINNYMAYVNDVLVDDRLLLKENIDKILDDYTFEGLFCFLNPEKIEQLLYDFPIQIKHHIATDGLNYVLKDKLNQMNDKEFKNWFHYHLRTCEVPSILGYSSHGLIIGEKKEKI